MAVAVGEKAPLAVAADELVDVAVGVAGAVSFTGVAEDHSRAVFFHAGAPIRFERIRGARPHVRAGNGPGPGRHAAALLQVFRAFANADRVAQTVGDGGQGHEAAAGEDSLTVDARLADAE